MKYIWFVLLVEVMSVVDSYRPLTNRGNYELYSFSTKAKSMAEVIYRMCLPNFPYYVNATARPSNPSFPHKFNVTILEIRKFSFIVELERVDQATGWDWMPITVDWSSYIIGKGMVYQNLILWFPDAADRTVMNLTMASKYCVDNGGRLVDIVDKAMYDVVYNYCRQTIVFGSLNWVKIWLGSSYNTTTDTVTQSNGKPGYNGDWWPGYPPRGSGYETWTGLMLDIKPPSSTNPNYGMVNYPPPSHHYVVQLCSTNLM